MASNVKKIEANIQKNQNSKKVLKSTYVVLNNVFDKTYNQISNTKTKIKSNINNTYLMKKTKWFRRFILKLLSSNPLIKAMILYLLVIFIFAGLLCIKIMQVPSFYNSSQNTFFYSFFTSLSTITAIGMMLNQIPDTYTVYGQIVLFFLLEFGGIIFSYIVSNVYLSFRSNKGNDFDNKTMIQIENGEKSINSSLSMLKWNILIIGGLQVVFGLSIFACIYYIPGYEPEANPYSNQYYVGFTNTIVPQYHNAPLALWSGIFDSVSSLYNAGMTLFGSANASVYRNGLGIIIQFLYSLEFILGGIGFPLFYDLVLKIKMRLRNSKYKLSLYSKWSLNAVFYVTLISTILAYIFSYTDHENTSIILATNYDDSGKLNTIYSPFGTDPSASKNWAIFFNMLNTHSAAFTSINLQNLSTGNKWVYIINMFIGCSPSATTGQIKLIILISTFYFLVKKVKFIKKSTDFKTSITKAMVWNSLMVVVFGLGISIGGTIIFYLCYYNVDGSNDPSRILDSIFLGVSIYSLCGMSYSMDFTTSYYGEIAVVIMVLMSQSMILFSIFVVRNNTYSDQDIKTRRLLEKAKKIIKKQNKMQKMI